MNSIFDVSANLYWYHKAGNDPQNLIRDLEDSFNVETIDVVKCKALILSGQFEQCLRHVSSIRSKTPKNILIWLDLFLAEAELNNGNINEVRKAIREVKKLLDYCSEEVCNIIELEIDLLDAQIDLLHKNYDRAIAILTRLASSEKDVIRDRATILRDPFIKPKEILGFVFSSPVTLKILDDIEKMVALKSGCLLISGPTGTGKTQLAIVYRHLYQKYHKITLPDLEIISLPHCGDNLIVAELFGATKGSFTDAKDTAGVFERHKNGVVLLDEIGELPLEAQPKLLQILQEKTFKRIGSNQVQNFKGSIICMTNRNLSQCVKDGTFREDLYFRLIENQVQMPSLEERKTEIEFVITGILKKLSIANKISIEIDPAAISHLKSFSYPGNIRELEQLIKSTLPELIHLSKNGKQPKISGKMILSCRKENSSFVDENFRVNASNTDQMDKQCLYVMSLANKTSVFTEAVDQHGENFLAYIVSIGNDLKLASLAEYRRELEHGIINYVFNKCNRDIGKTGDILNIKKTQLYDKLNLYNIK